MLSMDHWFRARWRALLGAVAAGVVLLAILWGAVDVYGDHLVDDARHEMLVSLNPHTRALAVAVDRRLSLLASLRAFAAVDPSTERLEAEFEAFARELHAGVRGVRNLTLAPGNVQTYVYPLDGNESLLGHDLTTDARPEIREQVAKATVSGELSLSGPYAWPDGSQRLVAYLAVVVDGAPWGLVSAVLDIPHLLEDGGLSDDGEGPRFVLVDHRGQAFAGDVSVLQQDPVSTSIALADTEWTLAAIPYGGWDEAVSDTLRAVWLSGALLTLVLAGQVYSLIHRERRIIDVAQELARGASEGYARLLSPASAEGGTWPEILHVAGMDAARITITLLVVGGLWMALADASLALLELDDRALARAHALKGWVFLVATSLLLFVVIRWRFIQTRRSTGLAAASDRRYRLLAENTLDAIWQMDLDGYLTYVNPGSEGLLGYAPHELTGASVETFVDGDDLDFLRGEMADAIRSGISGQIVANLRNRDGVLIPVEIRASVVVDPDGETVGLQGFARDIRERVASEREREQLLARIHEQMVLVERIINTVPDGVVLLDEACRPMLVNPSAERMLQLLGSRSWTEQTVMTHLGDRPLVEMLAPSPSGIGHEVSVGDDVFEIVARHLVDPQSETEAAGRWVLLLHDATSEREVRVRMEEQARLSALGQMAAGIAHDFNNILAVVMLYTQMALRGPEVESVTRERLQIVLEQSERAGALVQQILDFGRRSAIALAPTDLVSLLEEEAEMLKRTLPETILVTFAHLGGACVVRADRRRLQQAVMNLAVNARDAMSAGGVLALTVTGVEVDGNSRRKVPDLSPGRYARVTVEDSGAGIPRDILPHIFEPFFTTKQAGRGSGLGLAQVYGIVQQHRGQITVASDPGQGTCFTIHLPTTDACSEQGELAGLDAAPRGHRELVLLVEDHAATRVAVAESLELLNYRVVTAAHGGEALAILDQPNHGVGVVLSDFVMPQVDGRALFAALSDRDMPAPMVILTGHPMTDELEDMLADGLSGWLPKPPDLSRLAELLARAIGETAVQGHGGLAS